ncbi:protein kinase 2B, chloroplastic-like [Gossypium australe]|uniref:Protein kinase 2B, chloroplastic-like n=1 Tax=Gossypium australe TaxID=47621 RepID=A0A5B6VM70_9ROSI|nr:protein kinase 2B, chloroplastic-like [Gossypium australe]
MDEDIEVLMILGQPFLATTRTIIDVGNGELVLRVGITHENVLEPYLVQGDRNQGTSEEIMVHLDELDEWRIKVDKNLRTFKNVTKQCHGVHLKRTNKFNINVGDKVLLNNLDP